MRTLKIIPAFCIALVCCNSACKRTTARNDVFRYNEVTGIASLDPAFAKNQAVIWPVHQLYSTLVETDDSLRVKPLLAKRWEVSADRLEWRFTLRDDVFFHDDACFPGAKGRRVTAADVLYSFSRLMDPSTASPGAWIFNTRAAGEMPFAAPNDSTFVLRLRAPFNAVLGMLTMQYCSVVPREAVEKYRFDFRRHPVGTGPFRFVSWDEGRSLILRRNENYFESDDQGRRLPYLRGIHVSFYESKAAEFLEFRQKRIDFINDIDPAFKDELLTKTGKLKSEWRDDLSLRTSPYLNIEYLGILADTQNILLKNSPLRLLKIRRALNAAIDRKKMMLYLRNSIGIAADRGFVPPALHGPGARVWGFSYDPQLAQRLLNEAGFPGGRGMPQITLLSIPAYSNLASYIANDLQKSGFNIKVEIIQKSLLLQQTSRSEAAFFRGSWIADYPDAENYFSVFYGKNPAPPNYTRYHNAAFDAMYELASAEPDDAVRFALYEKMDSLLMTDAPVVPLWYDQVLHLVQPGIKGFRPNALNLLELRRARKLN